VRPTRKYTALAVLLLIAVMQVMPFVPTHEICEEACCEKPVSCCESMDSDGCEMAMTSCNTSMFIPLLTAPLIKVESNIQLDMAALELAADEIIEDQQDVELIDLAAVDDLSPPAYTPLLI